MKYSGNAFYTEGRIQTKSYIFNLLNILLICSYLSIYQPSGFTWTPILASYSVFLHLYLPSLPICSDWVIFIILSSKSLICFSAFIFCYLQLQGFPGGSAIKKSPVNAREGFDPWVGKIPQRRKQQFNPLQYSCLGNPMDRGALRATVYGVAKTQT